MRYLFECEECEIEFSGDFKMADRPDTTPCEKCGKDAKRILSPVSHIGEKCKGYGRGSNKGLKGH